MLFNLCIYDQYYVYINIYYIINYPVFKNYLPTYIYFQYNVQITKKNDARSNINQ